MNNIRNKLRITDKFLCIYKPFEKSADSDGYTFSSLKKNELCFINPAKFNDPFDSYIEIDEKVNVDKLKSAVRVLCLSDKFDNILMWSHYSNSHKGICLKFNKFKISDRNNSLSGMMFLNNNRFPKKYLEFVENDLGYKEPFLQVEPVEYTKYHKMPNPCIKKRLKKNDSYTRNAVFPFLMTKDSYWKYEKESRIILNGNMCKPLTNNSDKTIINFDKKYLEGVILGWKISPIYLAEICKVIHNEYNTKGYQTKIYTTIPLKGYYKLKIQELTLRTEKKIKYNNKTYSFKPKNFLEYSMLIKKLCGGESAQDNMIK